MGWSSELLIATQVIIDGEGDYLLLYNGEAAAGNLVGSIAAVAGTDDYGNAYLKGITVYTALTGVWWAFNIYGSGFENSPIGFAVYESLTYAGPYAQEAIFNVGAGGPLTGWVSSPIYGIQ